MLILHVDKDTSDLPDGAWVFLTAVTHLTAGGAVAAKEVSRAVGDGDGAGEGLARGCSTVTWRLCSSLCHWQEQHKMLRWYVQC